jgi:hypothetical protein
MKKVLIVLGVIALIVGFILFCCWLGKEVAEFQFNQWKEYVDYLDKGEA